MITYSAAQAISPAIERTRQFLFRPFRWGRFLKLTLVAMLTEGGMSSCNFGSNFPSEKTAGRVPLHMPHIPQMHWPAMAVVIGVVAVVALIMIPLSLLISYLLIRLRFSYFDCVLRMQGLIAPAWRRYHRQAMRYLGLSVCIGIVFIAIMAAVGYGLYVHFKPLFDSMGSGSQPNFFDFLPLIGVVLPLFLLLGLCGAVVNGLASYFVLPHMALEDASIADSLSDVWSDVQFEPGQFALFFVLRFVLTLAASILGMVALIVAAVIVAIVGILIGLILKAISGTLVFAVGVPAGIVAGAIFLLAVMGLGGTIGTFRRNYALLFYGGRYPRMGDILAPPLPPMPAPWVPGVDPGIPPGIPPGSVEGV
jgi:hypothetical protein